jgi:DNA-binding LytR/AlgR family response regulator
MKINIFSQPGLKENHLDIYYDEMDWATGKAIEFANSINQQIEGKMDDETRLISSCEVYYFEVADRRCFAYLEDSVWQVKLSLQDIQTRYGSKNFIRIGKSMVVNLNYVQVLKPDLNARVKIVLKNGETVILNRKFRSEFLNHIERLGKK